MADTQRKLNKAISVLLGVIAAVLLVSAIVLLVIHYWPAKENYSNFKNNVSTVSDPVLPANPIDFDALKAQNDDVCGWINFDCLDIDYPIVCAGPDKPEEYYLRRDLEGKYSTAGTIFIQKVNAVDFSDPCTVVYGHNMTNLTMFGTLKKFRDKEFFDQNKYFSIYRPGHIMKYAIKSAFVYDDRHISYSFDFTTEAGFNAFAEEVNNPKSLVKNVREDVQIMPDSKLVVLSTCTNVDPERYLVVGVLVEDKKTK